MLKELFSNRLFIGALAFFILSVVGGTLYISHVEKQGAEKLATDEDSVKQVTEKQQQQPPAKAPVAEETSQGHFHADGTWHEGEHEPVEPPSIVEVHEPEAETSGSFDNLFSYTDDEISKMTSDDRSEIVYNLTRIMIHVSEKKRAVSAQRMSLVDEMNQISEALGAGRITTGEWSQKYTEMRKHQSKLQQESQELSAERDRIRQNIRRLSQ